MKRTNIFTHLAAAANVTILMALIYVTVQQVYRSGANDPQLQLAGDISHKLRKSEPVDKWFSGDTIEISQSLSVFTTLFNDKNEPVLTTGVLDGNMPSLPKGVFDHALRHGENVFTWQPRKGIRVAVILRSLQLSSYSYVAIGRSLYEVEKREEHLRWMVLISWLLCMGVIMVHWIVTFSETKKNANG